MFSLVSIATMSLSLLNNSISTFSSLAFLRLGDGKEFLFQAKDEVSDDTHAAHEYAT